MCLSLIESTWTYFNFPTSLYIPFVVFESYYTLLIMLVPCHYTAHYACAMSLYCSLCLRHVIILLIMLAPCHYTAHYACAMSLYCSLCLRHVIILLIMLVPCHYTAHYACAMSLYSSLCLCRAVTW